MRPSRSSPARTPADADPGTPAALERPPLNLVPPAVAQADAAALPAATRALRFLDGPLAGILMGNATTLAGVMFQHWPVLPVLLIYLGQNAAIGVANVIRMLRVRSFSTDGFRMNGRRVPETPAGQRAAARFFALHFGVFHLAYALFLLGGRFGRVTGWGAVTIAANVALFAGAHAWHAVRDSGREFRARPNLGTLMFYPYLRVLPMHLAILLGAAFPQGAMPVFIVLKTAADLGMHEVERRLLWRPGD